MQTKALYEDIKIWRDDWLQENDPQDGTDCVTPFDKWLYSPPANDNQQAGLSRHAFLNACRILMNVSKHELESAGVMKVGQVGGSDWTRFNKDPLMFMAKLPDDRMGALWGLIQSRQPEEFKN